MIWKSAIPVRAAIVHACEWPGLRLDPEANAAHGPRITVPGARPAAWVIPTHEEWVIARGGAVLVA